MLLFITWNLVLFHLMLNFNTSHVTVYLRATDRRRVLLTFQYISCYCLSKKAYVFRVAVKHFNTSHVTVYRCRRSGRNCRCIISIHLMLLFIDIARIKNPIKKNFNTSHVTVYHAFSKNIVKQMIFQYISCYCLSSSPSSSYR